MLETLLSRPEFAWNLLVFTGDEETLRRADEKKEKLGLELAAYYKNHTAGEESGELVPRNASGPLELADRKRRGVKLTCIELAGR
ncbi:MAG: hypothetical protein ACLR2E_20700 [Lachnospiraceae bacterium]